MTVLPLAVVVCPHPPALVPEVAPGADDDLGAVRQACDDAVRALIAAGPDRVVVIGEGDMTDDRDESAGGTLEPWGADVRGGGPERVLPLSLTIGAWLLDRAGWAGARTYSTGHPTTSGRDVVLVMADGTAKRSTAAPGFFDERAEAYDRVIAEALAGGDADALTSLDVDLGDELWAAGVGALRTMGAITKGAHVTARLRYDGAPLGVGYFVADWGL